MSTFAYLCPTPKEHCGGSLGTFSAALEKKGIKKHGSAEECLKCYSRYLVNVKGYTKIGTREFRPPDGGPIEMLSKPHSFGAKLRTGKSGEGAAKGKGRGMPAVRNGGSIIST